MSSFIDDVKAEIRVSGPRLKMDLILEQIKEGKDLKLYEEVLQALKMSEKELPNSAIAAALTKRGYSLRDQAVKNWREKYRET